MTPRFNRLLVVLLLLVGLPGYWLLLDSRAGDAAAKPLAIAGLRALAAGKPGALPLAVEMEEVAFRRLPGNLMVAGSGMKRKLIGVMAFRLPVPGGKAIVIDSGMTARQAAEMDMEQYDAAAQARVDAALGEASLVLLTHEHPDHSGGFMARLAPAGRRFSDPIQAKYRGFFGQNRALFGENGPFPGEFAPFAVAPGVVVIPAPSHTPGSQMIFARLEGGEEYLFTGDIATFAQSWQELRARSRLVSQWTGAENRREVYCWLLTIRALKAEAPGLHVIPGHDYEWLIDPVNASRVVHRFFTVPVANKPLAMAETVR